MGNHAFEPISKTSNGNFKLVNSTKTKKTKAKNQAANIHSIFGKSTQKKTSEATKEVDLNELLTLIQNPLQMCTIRYSVREYNL